VLDIRIQSLKLSPLYILDLKVIIRSDLKSVSQCNKSAATARVIWMVRRQFKRLHTDDFRNISVHTWNTVSKPGLHIWLRLCITGKCSESSNKPYQVEEIQLPSQAVEVRTHNSERQKRLSLT